MPESVPDFIAVIDRLNAEGVRFVLIGGLAMIAHGSARLTFDIDVSFARDSANLNRLAKALHDFDPRPRDYPADLPFVWDASTLRFATNTTLSTTAGDVDLIGEPPGAMDFEALYHRAVEMTIFGHPVRVASLDDLESMKLALNRTKDLDHLLDIEALRRMKSDVEPSE